MKRHPDRCGEGMGWRMWLTGLFRQRLIAAGADTPPRKPSQRTCPCLSGSPFLGCPVEAPALGKEEGIVASISNPFWETWDSLARWLWFKHLLSADTFLILPCILRPFFQNPAFYPLPSQESALLWGLTAVLVFISYLPLPGLFVNKFDYQTLSWHLLLRGLKWTHSPLCFGLNCSNNKRKASGEAED